MSNAFAQNNVMTLLIGKDVGSATPTTSAGSPILDASDTYLLNGEIAVVNPHNIVLNASTVKTDSLAEKYGIRVVQRSGSTLVFSDLIKRSNVVSYKGKTDAADTQQVSYLGYNGTNQAIDVLNSNTYEVRLNFHEGDVHGQAQRPVLASAYKSDTTATQQEIAAGLHLALAGSLGKSSEAPVRCERTVKAASITDSDNILTVVNGSKYVTWTTLAQYGSTNFAAGDVIRIGTSGSGAASTDPAYVLTSISSLVGTLDVPFQGVSGAIPATDVAHVTTPSDWGLKFTGLARNAVVGKQGTLNNLVRFTVGLDNFGSTVATYTTAAAQGSGTYAQIAELEWALQGNDGNVDRADFMHSTARADALSTATYDMITMSYYGDDQAGLSMIQRSPKQLIVALATGFSDTEGPDVVAEILDNFAGASSGVTAAS